MPTGFRCAQLTWETPLPHLAALTELSGIWADRAHERKPLTFIILDMDSSENPTHGDQEGSAYNGHVCCTCNTKERCLLRPGTVHSAEDWRIVLEPVVGRYRKSALRRYFRADAAFAKPAIYEVLDAEGYAIR